MPEGSGQGKASLQAGFIKFIYFCIHGFHLRFYKAVESKYYTSKRKTEILKRVINTGASLVSCGEEVFTCKQCGQCCEGRGGIVLSKKDLLRLADFLKCSPQEVIDKYGEYSNGKLKLRTGEHGYCVFFNHAASCAVHEGKPDICRAWPFFRGNLLDEFSLSMAQDFCPGINKKISFAKFVSEGFTYLKKEGLLASDTGQDANALLIHEEDLK